MEPLDADAISLPGAQVRVVERCASTNSVLLREPLPREGAVLLVAEEQTAGRGRLGRRWHSARGASLTLSLARLVRRPARELPGLSLAAGLAVARALRAFGAGVGLKWPNDLVVDDAKLGGILVETRAMGAAALAVVGVGLNYRRVPGLEARLRRRIASLEDLLAPLPPRRALVERAGAELLAAIDAFEREGLQAARAGWESLHAHAGRRLRVRLGDGRIVTGVAEGLGEDGSLRLRRRGGVLAVANGRIVGRGVA